MPCESWCENPCAELTGSVEAECNGCDADGEWRCRPGAPGFPSPPLRPAPSPLSRPAPSLRAPTLQVPPLQDVQPSLETPLRLLGEPMGSNLPYVCEGMPAWQRRAVETSALAFDPNNAQIGETRMACPAERDDAVGGLHSLDAPDYTGQPVALPRIRAPLSAADFYRRFVRMGLPFILTNVLSPSAAASAASAVGSCCEAEYGRKRIAHNNLSRDNCDRYDPDSWCDAVLSTPTRPGGAGVTTPTLTTQSPHRPASSRPSPRAVDPTQVRVRRADLRRPVPSARRL